MSDETRSLMMTSNMSKSAKNPHFESSGMFKGHWTCPHNVNSFWLSLIWELDTFTIFTLVLSFFWGLLKSFTGFFLLKFRFFCNQHDKYVCIFIFMFGLSVCLLVCIQKPSKRLNRLGPNFFLTTRMTLGKIYGRLKL